MRRRLQAGGGLALLVLAAIQIVPVDRSNPPSPSPLQAPAEVTEILDRACFDCHSHRTRWPWYARVAPVSWLVAAHVDDGRRDLNFSAWPTFDFAAQDLLLADVAREVERGTMPPASYLWLHPEARLDSAALAVLLEWTGPGPAGIGSTP